MFGTFIITLRELAELALIVATLGACLKEANQHRLVWLMLVSVVAGMAIGGAMGASLLDWAELDVRSTGMLHMGLALGILLLVSTSLLAESRIALNTHAWVQRALHSALAPWVVALFACLVAGREMLEIVVLVNSVWKPEKAAGQLMGVLAGGASIVSLALVWKRVRPLIEGWALFRLSALVTGVVAVELFLDGAADYLYAEGMAQPEYHWMVALSRALEAGSWVGWVSTAIMAWPALLVFRSIWRGTAPTRNEARRGTLPR